MRNTSSQIDYSIYLTRLGEFDVSFPLYESRMPRDRRVGGEMSIEFTSRRPIQDRSSILPLLIPLSRIEKPTRVVRQRTYETHRLRDTDR